MIYMHASHRLAVLDALQITRMDIAPSKTWLHRLVVHCIRQNKEAARATRTSSSSATAFTGLAAVTGLAAAAVPGWQLHAARGCHLWIRPQTRVAAGAPTACNAPSKGGSSYVVGSVKLCTAGDYVYY